MSMIILCVDDSTTMQQVAEITFRGTSFTYVGARSADEAINIAKAQKPSLVLADAVLGPAGSKSGYDVCLAIKSDPDTANIPVVIMCGNSAAYDTAKGEQSGADGTLPKPWDTAVMLEKCLEIAEKGSSAKPVAAVGRAPVAAKAAIPSAPRAVPSVAAAPATAAQPPRSATIMGMPTIKLPGGGSGGVAGPVPTISVPPVAAASAAPAPLVATSVATSVATGNGVGRPPMVAGSMAKRSALVESTMAKMAARLAEATGLQAGSPELLALLKLSAEIVERVVWEVVPELAEQIIRENLENFRK